MRPAGDTRMPSVHMFPSALRNCGACRVVVHPGTKADIGEALRWATAPVSAAEPNGRWLVNEIRCLARVSQGPRTHAPDSCRRGRCRWRFSSDFDWRRIRYYLLWLMILSDFQPLVGVQTGTPLLAWQGTGSRLLLTATVGLLPYVKWKGVGLEEMEMIVQWCFLYAMVLRTKCYCSQIQHMHPLGRHNYCLRIACKVAQLFSNLRVNRHINILASKLRYLKMALSTTSQCSALNRTQAEIVRMSLSLWHMRRLRRRKAVLTVPRRPVRLSSAS